MFGGGPAAIVVDCRRPRILYDRHGCESGGTVDAVNSKSTAARHGGSNPPSRTNHSLRTAPWKTPRDSTRTADFCSGEKRVAA